MMGNGFGPYGVISTGEIAATLSVAVFALMAFAWMAYRTRRQPA